MLAADTLVAQNIGFGLLAAIMVIAGIRVVTVNNVVHAALYLVLVLSAAAGQFVLMTAEFVAITQVLVYVGAVMVLFLFGTMLTRAKIGAEADLDHPKGRQVAIPVSLLMLGVMAYVLIDGFGDTKAVEDPADVTPLPIAALSDNIFDTYLMPFWALSFVLLIALIGGIVLARRD